MWDFSLQVCWRWKRKIPSAWGQYRSFYGALEHTWNINLLTFHLQTLGTHSPFTQIPSFAKNAGKSFPSRGTLIIINCYMRRKNLNVNFAKKCLLLQNSSENILKIIQSLSPMFEKNASRGSEQNSSCPNINSNIPMFTLSGATSVREVSSTTHSWRSTWTRCTTRLPSWSYSVNIVHQMKLESSSQHFIAWRGTCVNTNVL